MAKPVSTNAKRPAAEARPPADQPATRSPLSRRLHPTAKKILAASRRILAERGYQGLTLQAIAIEAGVNKAGVWYYFGGKEQLVLALLEDIAVTDSLHFGARPAAGATLDERVDLIVDNADQVKQRVERYVAFYELLPEASRDAKLREHLMAYYRGWYAWAGEVLAPPGADSETRARTAATLGQFAAILLDGIFMQMVVGAPDFDLETALHDARRTLRYLLDPEAADGGRRL